MIISINYKDRQGDGYDSRNYSYRLRYSRQLEAPTC